MLRSFYEFELCSEVFLRKLEPLGNEELSKALRREYFQGIKCGWARCMMPWGSAATNNSLESFNGNSLSRDIVAGSRMTMAQLFASLEGYFWSLRCC